MSLVVELWQTLLETLRDVAPIVLMLVFFQFFVLRDRLAAPLRVLRGFIYVIVGMVLFLLGLEQAIFPLGEVMARQLTDADFLGVADGAVVHWLDYLWVYLFAFLIGVTTTIAEPALIAVGMKAERISGGAISSWGLRLAVSLGVGVGVTIGCYRIVTGTDLWLYIIGAYILVVLQTWFAPRLIIPLAYDSGGVTTSTVTVPLLAALGLGLASSIPGRSPLIDGFGLIAFASVFPVMSVIAYAWLAAWREQRKNDRSQAG